MLVLGVLGNDCSFIQQHYSMLFYVEVMVEVCLKFNE